MNDTPENTAAHESEHLGDRVAPGHTEPKAVLPTLGKAGVGGWLPSWLGSEDPVWGERDSPGAIRDEVSRWRVQLLELGLLLATLSAALVIVILLIFSAETGRDLAVKLIPLPLVTGIALAWRGLPYTARGYALIGIYWFGIVVGTLLRGYALPNPFVGGLFICVLAALIFRPAHAWRVVCTTILLVVMTSIPWVLGRQSAPDGFADPTSVMNWTRVLLIFSLFASVTTAAVLFLVNKLETALGDLGELVLRLDASHAEADRAMLAAEVAREEAERANQSKSHFLAMMSHDLRTPLTAVVGMCEVLRDEDPGQQGDERLTVLEDASRTLLMLVNDILDLSRVESGRVVLERTPVDMHRLVNEVVAIAGAEAEQRSLSLTGHVEGPPWVLGDPLRIRQILHNLVGNALKFTVQGGVEVRCAVAPAEGESGVNVVLSVHDSGIGISAENRERVFENFAQAEARTARVSGGSGLGLGIVRGLVELMGGSIVLDSVEGEGSTFTVRFSAEAAEAPEAPVSEASRLQIKAMSPRVLVVDDNPTNRKVLDLMLTRLGCEVGLAADGAVAVSTVCEGERQYDLVLMDCMMPVMDGFEATRAIRAAGSSVPIIAMTANATEDDRRACLAAGMGDFASKPVTLEALEGILIRNLQVTPR